MDRKWRRRNEDIIETKEEWYIKRISRTKVRKRREKERKTNKRNEKEKENDQENPIRYKELYQNEHETRSTRHV